MACLGAPQRFDEVSEKLMRRLHGGMSFSETDHPRANDGTFSNKVGSAPELHLDGAYEHEQGACILTGAPGENDDDCTTHDHETDVDERADRYDALTADLTDEEITAAQGVARAFAPNSNLAIVKVMETDTDSVGWSIGLMEENGAIHYKYIPDGEGVPSRVYVAGEAVRYDSDAFRAAEDGARAALGLPPFKDERERNDRHVEIEAERAIRNGVLVPSKLMNGVKDAGDWSYQTPDLTRIATGPNGERLSVGVSLERVSKLANDINGVTVNKRYDFSMTGDIRSKTGAWEGGGQVGDYLYGVDPYKKGSKSVDVDPTRLAELWEKNHLNGLNAGTPYQDAWIAKREETLGRKLTTAERLDETPNDPQTDYKYGRAWLYRDVPADDIAEVLDAMRSAQAVSR